MERLKKAVEYQENKKLELKRNADIKIQELEQKNKDQKEALEIWEMADWHNAGESSILTKSNREKIDELLKQQGSDDNS